MMRINCRTAAWMLIGPTWMLAGSLAAASPHCDMASEKAAPTARKAHADHNPRHGGVFFMASDGKHHLEGVYLPSRELKIYLYDEYTVPLLATHFSGWIELRDGRSMKIPLRLADDGTLVATLPPMSFPIAVDAWLSYSEPGRKEFSDLFTFEFERVSVQPPAKKVDDSPTADRPRRVPAK